MYQRNPKNEKWDRIEGIKYTSNLEELLKDEEIQLIVVCTMQDSHYDYAKLVLENNKHCLVEKPFMETSKEAKEIFDLAKSKGLIVQAYQNRRFDSDFLTVQKVIESGKLGELLELEMHFDYYRPEIPESVNRFVTGESYLYGHGCHTLDQVISYFGKPDSIH
ncbi:Gfo/Idh/MocA family oxidoreductase, partial [Clostridium saudiense]|nr:Gfo/Idh/MocA family oxidoreductase [Clostridium saudiense]